MPSDRVYEKLTEILREVFDDETLVARPELTANDVARWDSFAQLRLILSVEDAFGVSFTASQIAGLDSVGDLAALITSQTAG